MKRNWKSVAVTVVAAWGLNSCVVYDYPMYTSASFGVSSGGVSTSVTWTDAQYDVNGFPIFGYAYGQPVYGYTASGSAVFSFYALTSGCCVPSWGPAHWYCGHWHYPKHIHRVSVPPRHPAGHHPGRRPGAHHKPAVPHRPAVNHRPGHAPGHGVVHRPASPGRPGVNHRPGHANRPQMQRPGMQHNRPQVGRPGTQHNRPQVQRPQAPKLPQLSRPGAQHNRPQMQRPRPQQHRVQMQRPQAGMRPQVNRVQARPQVMQRPASRPQAVSRPMNRPGAGGGRNFSGGGHRGGAHGPGR